MSTIESLVAYQLSIISTAANANRRCSTLPSISLTCSTLTLAIGVRVEEAVVDEPEMLRLGVHVDARGHPHGPDHALLVAAAPLLTRHLDLRAEALVEDGILEDQVRIRIGLQQRLYLLP